MSTKKIYTIFALLMLATLSSKAEVFSTIEPLDEQTNIIHITFKMPKGDFIYKEFLDIIADSPNVQLGPMLYSHEAIPHYDKTFKETKKIFQQPFTISFRVTKENGDQSLAYIHATYYQHSNKRCITQLIPLTNEVKTLIDNTNIAIDTATLTSTSTQQKNVENEKATLETWLLIGISWLKTPWFIVLILLLSMLILYALPRIARITLILICSFFYVSWLILPLHIFFWFIASCALCTGLYLLAAPLIKQKQCWYRSLAGMILIAGSLIGFAKAYSHTYMHRSIEKIKTH